VVIGDATRLHQVVTNLCSNAIQAMSGGGTLRVALDAAGIEAGRALSHGTLGSGRYVRLSVEDSGSGMDEATLSRIFEPFYTTKEIGQGTGLGLALVHAIVTDSGGAIDVKSALKQGSTFTIYLTQAEIALAAADDTAAAPPRGNASVCCSSTTRRRCSRRPRRCSRGSATYPCHSPMATPHSPRSRPRPGSSTSSSPMSHARADRNRTGECVAPPSVRSADRPGERL